MVNTVRIWVCLGGFVCGGFFFFCGEHKPFELPFTSEVPSSEHMFSKLLLLFVF